MAVMVDDTDKTIAAAVSMLDKRSPDYESQCNQLIAHNSVHAERAGEGRLHIDDAAREHFLFYGRQDSAHALLNTITMLRKMNELQSSVRHLTWLVLALTVAVAALILKARW